MKEIAGQFPVCNTNARFLHVPRQGCNGSWRWKPAEKRRMPLPVKLRRRPVHERVIPAGAHVRVQVYVALPGLDKQRRKPFWRSAVILHSIVEIAPIGKIPPG